MNKILLSFDVEEFDLPFEYNINFPKQEQFEFSFQGLKKVLKILEKNKEQATFFVTASFALKYPQMIRNIAKTHEIASHSLHHQVKEYNEDETRQSKQIIENIIKKPIQGFRFPRLQKVDYNSLKELGFKYSSSISPTYIPGRYNNYFEKRKIIQRNQVFEIPISTTQLIHVPFSWIFFRFLGPSYSKIATLSCMKNPGFTNLFFHPWEFNNLKQFKIPFYIKRNSGDKALKMLQNYMFWCKKKKYEFMTFEDFLEHHTSNPYNHP